MKKIDLGIVLRAKITREKLSPKQQEIEVAWQIWHAVLDGDVVALLKSLQLGVEPQRIYFFGDPLVSAAASSDKGDSISVLAVLISKGCDINEGDRDGWTPLMYAARKGQMETARLLLEMGCDRYALNNRGQCATEIADEERHSEVSSLICCWGLDWDD